MNCRPGDMAYTVAPWIEEKRGCPVRVLRLATLDDLAHQGLGPPPFVVWYCEGGAWPDGKRQGVIADESLRPIRAPGLTDEHVRELYSTEPIRREQPQREGA